MNAFTSFISWLASLFEKAPIKIIPTVFVKPVEIVPQRKFGLVYFKLRIFNNSKNLAVIQRIETGFPVRYYFCGSLIYAKTHDELVYLEEPDDMPLEIPAQKSEELVFCAGGIPVGASFGVRSESLNAYEPTYILTIT